MKDTQGFEEKVERLRVRGLERQTLELLKTTRWGQVYAAIYLLIGIASIFLCIFILHFNVLPSAFLGIVTWFIVSFIADTILIKTQRIDKQLDWLLRTPKGLAELKRRGMTNEQIGKLRAVAQEFAHSNRDTQPLT